MSALSSAARASEIGRQLLTQKTEKNVDVDDSSIKAYAGSEPTTGVDDVSPNAS